MRKRRASPRSFGEIEAGRAAEKKPNSGGRKGRLTRNPGEGRAPAAPRLTEAKGLLRSGVYFPCRTTNTTELESCPDAARCRRTAASTRVATVRASCLSYPAQDSGPDTLSNWTGWGLKRPGVRPTPAASTRSPPRSTASAGVGSRRRPRRAPGTRRGYASSSASTPRCADRGQRTLGHALVGRPCPPSDAAPEGGRGEEANGDGPRPLGGSVLVRRARDAPDKPKGRQMQQINLKFLNPEVPARERYVALAEAACGRARPVGGLGRRRGTA